MVSYIWDVFCENINSKTCLVTLLLIVITWLYRSSRPKLNLAPGPKFSYPWFGHLPLLTKDSHITLNEYRKKYGPIFSIKFGRKYTVVLGDFARIKEAHKIEGGNSRAEEVYNLSPHFKNLVELNGSEWMERRRFAMSVLRTTARERSTEDIIQEEVTRLLDSLGKRDLSKDVDTTKLLGTVANNVGFSIVCGKSFDEDDPGSQFLLNFNHGILDYFQWMPFGESLEIPKFIYRKLFPKVRSGEDAINKMDEFIKQEIIEHEKTLNPENPRDFIDFALIEMKKSDGYKKIHECSNTIRGDCQILLLGGTDTSRTTMEWFLLLLAKHPEIQEKAYQEILNVLGDRRPTWADRTLLPFVDACIMESQRMFTLVPLNLVRKAHIDLKISGYDVPRGSWIFGNIWAVHNDPELWKNPQEFNPSRFLSKQGDRTIEPEYWIPYSTGNRNCLGDRTARMEIFITLTAFMQHYRVLPSTKGVSFEGELRLSYHAVYPDVRLQKRIGK